MSDMRRKYCPRAAASLDEKLEHLRKLVGSSRDIKIEAIASNIGVSRATVYNWLRGLARPASIKIIDDAIAFIDTGFIVTHVPSPQTTAERIADFLSLPGSASERISYLTIAKQLIDIEIAKLEGSLVDYPPDCPRCGLELTAPGSAWEEQ